MNSAEMAKVIRARAGRMRDPGLTVGELADNAELMVVLARIIEGKSIDRAFGRPGDWGYEHPIGRALAAKESEAQL
jgi:hypothetical protein